MGYSTVDETTTMMWAMLQRHEVMEELSKHELKRYPSITFIFVRFLIVANISESLQETAQMKRETKVFINKSDLHHGRLTNIKQ